MAYFFWPKSISIVLIIVVDDGVLCLFHLIFITFLLGECARVCVCLNCGLEQNKAKAKQIVLNCQFDLSKNQWSVCARALNKKSIVLFKMNNNNNNKKTIRNFYFIVPMN